MQHAYLAAFKIRLITQHRDSKSCRAGTGKNWASEMSKQLQKAFHHLSAEGRRRVADNFGQFSVCKRACLHVGCRYLRATCHMFLRKVNRFFSQRYLSLENIPVRLHSTFTLRASDMTQVAVKLRVCLKAKPTDGQTSRCVDKDGNSSATKTFKCRSRTLPFAYILAHFFPQTPMSAVTKDFDSHQRKAFGTLHIIRSRCKV